MVGQATLPPQQDDVDDSGETATLARVKQNFKLVDWRTVKAALHLE
jgi:3-phytase